MEYILAAHDFGIPTMAILDTLQQFGYSTLNIEAVEACINLCREAPRRKYIEPDYAFRLIDHICRTEEMDLEHVFHLLWNRGFPVASPDEVAEAVDIMYCMNSSLQDADKESAEWRKAVLTWYNFGFTVLEVHDRCRGTKTLKQVNKVICDELLPFELVRTGREWDEVARKFWLASYHLGMSFPDIILDLNVHGFDQGTFGIIFLHELMKSENLIDDYRIVRDGTILTWSSPDNKDLPIRVVHPVGIQVEGIGNEEIFKPDGFPDSEGEDHK